MTYLAYIVVFSLLAMELYPDPCGTGAHEA